MLASSLVLLIAIAALFTGADAVWTVEVATAVIGSLERTLSTGGSSSIVRINMVNDEVQFLPAMANDRTIFPDSCVSSSTNNKYGWDAYKSRIFESLYVGGNTLQLRLQAVDGFSPTETETISCSVFAGADGTSYIKSGSMSPGDKTVSFQITSETALIRAKLETIDSTGKAVALSVTTPMPLTEIIMRDQGFILNAVIYGDVWDQSMKSAILNGFSCVSTLAAGCSWFYSVVNNPSYVFLNDTAPQRLMIYVPRTVTRLVDIDADLTIQLTLPNLDSDSVRYGLKSSPRLSLYDSDRKFTFPVATRTPDLTARQTQRTPTGVTFTGVTTTSFTLTENCIRGVNTTDACAMVFWVVTDAGVAQDMEFSSTPQALADLNETALKSQILGGYLNVFTKITLLTTTVGTRLRALQAQLNAAPLYRYDISTRDTLTLTIPYSMYSVKEMAAAPVVVYVLPSPGEVDTGRSTVRNIEQKDLWIGGFTFRVAIGGETFRSAVAASLIASYTSGSLGPSTGWGQYRSCALPPSQVYFEDATLNAIVLNFTACPGYVQSGDEVVTFSLPTTAATTNLAIGNQSALTFTIYKSPGVFIMTGGQEYLEEELQDGNVSISFALQGGETFVSSGSGQWASCLSALVNAWSSDVTRDPNAWISNATRQSLFAGAVTRVSSTQMVIHFNASTLYDTRKGETIRFSKFPGQCLTYGISLNGFKNYSMTILPRQGEVRVGYQYPGQPILFDNEVSESMMRRGGFSWVVEVVNDEFDYEKSTTLPDIVVASLVTSSLEPNGFLTLKSQLVNRNGVTFSSDWKQAFIDVASVIKFDVQNNETVVVNVTGDWMGSGRSPTNYGESNIVIYKSAGDIILSDWFGANRSVTEDNMRSGDVWFKFGLLGDQWRVERDPYLQAFTGSDASATAFTALRDTIIPSIEFFEFESSAIYEYLTLRLQSNSAYDIFLSETITIQFPSNSVVGDLAPFFSGNGVANGIQQFVVAVTPGRLVLSGATQLNEKKIRQGGIEMYLTLFGEKWATATDPALCVRQNMHLATLATDQQLNESILPYSSSGTTQSDVVELQSNLIEIPLRRYRSYDIDYGMTDVLSINVPGKCVQSNLAPSHRPLSVPIAPTEGELRLSSTDPVKIFESDVRTFPIKVVFELDGDTWNQDLSNNPTAIVAGFASTSSSISEPNGFFTSRTSLLNLGIGLIPDVRLTETTLEVSFQPTSTYDITNDETITFSIADPSFVTSGRLPSPSTVSFVVSITVKTIILIIDDTLPNSIKDGRYDTLRLRTLIANLLSCDVSRVSAYVNTTRADNLLVVPLVFAGTTSVTDTRGNTELEEYFMNTKLAYLRTNMGIRQVYYSDSPPSDTTGSTDGGSGSSSSGGLASTTSGFEKGMWVVGSITFIAILVAIYACVMYVKQSKLGGRVRRAVGAQSDTDRYKVVHGEEAAADDIDSPLGDPTYYDTTSHFKHSTKLFQDRASAGLQSAKARVDTHGEGFTDRPRSLNEYARYRRAQNDPEALKFDHMIVEARQRLVVDADGEGKQEEEAIRRAHVMKAQKLLEERRAREQRETEEAQRSTAVNSDGSRVTPSAVARNSPLQDESRVRFQRTFDRMMDFYN